MASLYSEIKSFYKKNGIVVRILLINIFIFVAYIIIGVFAKLTKTDITQDIALQLSASSDVKTFFTHPWTMITYMFAHFDFLHIFFNMLMFYFAGQFFTTLLGSQKLISTYIIGGIFGLFVFILSYNIFPALEIGLGGYINGASASVMAVFVTLGAFAPNTQISLLFFGSIRMIYLVLIFVLLDFARLSTSLDLANPSAGNAGGWLAHIGGAIYGAWFGYQMSKGRDISKWYDKLMARIKSMFKPRKKMKVMHSRPVTDEEYADIKFEKQQKIDRILDKISKSGYESLSKAEKDFLFNASKDV